MDRSLGILKSNSNRIFFPVRGVAETFDQIASIIILASLLVGFWGAGEEIGSFSTIVQNVLDSPTKWGFGLLCFYVGLDSWCPTIPSEYLGCFSFLRYLYPFAEGYLPHYSFEAALFSLVISLIVTWFYLHLSDEDFWFKGLGVAILSFIIAWIIWGWISWYLMFYGGNLIGLTDEQIHEIWLSSAKGTSPIYLQYFFLLSIPTSFIWLIRKIV